MKKIVITLVVLGCAFVAKAQLAPGPLLKQQLFRTDSLGAKPVTKINVTGNRNVDNMPIANMPGRSNMPIVQTDRTAYNMLVAGMQQPQIYTMKKPGTNPEVLPSFDGKAPVFYEFKKYPDNNPTPPADINKP